MALTEDRKMSYIDGVELPVALADDAIAYKGALITKDSSGYGRARVATAGDSFAGVALDSADNTNGGNGGKTITVARLRAYWLPTTDLTAASIGKTAYLVDDEKVRAYDADPGAINISVGRIIDYDANKGVRVDCDGKENVTAGMDLDLDDIACTSLTAEGNVAGESGTFSVNVYTPLISNSNTDISITAPATKDVIVTVGDNAGLNKVSILDSDLAEVASINSDGWASFASVLVDGEAVAIASELASTDNGLGASLVGIEDALTLITATDVEGALAELAGAVGDAQSDATQALQDASDAQGDIDQYILDVASTDNAKGASLVGIEDALTLITATTVEGALAELAGRSYAVLYGAADTDGAPTQAELVAALGAGVDGQVGVFLDNHLGALTPYLCGFSTAGGGWWYIALTAVGA